MRRLKIINPDEYRDVLELAYLAADIAIPIFVTAFGDVFI